MRFATAVTLPAAALLASGAAVYASPTSQSPTSCDKLQPPKIPGVKYQSVQRIQHTDAPFPNPLTGGTVPLSYCEVIVTLSHAGGNDNVIVKTWLPNADKWNGRFQGTGGGGYRAGYLDIALAPAVARGYAAVSTDAGVGLSDTGDFILKPNSTRIDKTLLENFSKRSLHEMTVMGKDLTRQFYGKKHFYSYWNGCSTGGRQGYMEAQNYPEDYEGLLAAAPAINWARFVPAGYVVDLYRQKIGYNKPACELAEITKRAVDACDGLDGFKDGIVAATSECHFDASTLVGQPFTCSTTGESLTFSKEGADIANLAWHGFEENGKRVWYGANVGTNLTQVSGIDTTFTHYSDAWLRLAVEQNRAFNLTTLDAHGLYKAVKESVKRYDDLIGTADPDLRKAYKHGAKILTWQGLQDQAVLPTGVIDYYTRVKQKLGGKVNIDDFYRVFFAPGVQHCQGGTGPLPDDPLAALVDWVEKGKAPDRLPATTQDSRKLQQPLCKYPKLPRYTANGDLECRDTAFAQNFTPLDPLRR
ncbi:uncharacterized protein PFL1_06124 [Pseudozyma flocculosa PF-1]|uniref:Carboxylic ester hydrolase n=2 Tax=Pseudozyma flocculosa TaxID=84751 RepID=A0A5C3F9S6_9BASI|nr:uncharacterized protein PFL1_06124 [Pseudozyma flocculosa PF-1]EPQ26188.1 hypothetical protein PFL1_06124 [Pseudozyma flocculosa PF-1]SPO40141.1 related to tannase precursor [Pseudozyma flocculosa]